MSDWKYVGMGASHEIVDPTIGDRGMTELDGAIFAEVMIRMFDKEKRKYYDSMEFALGGTHEYDRRETRCWLNANRSVNW